VASQESNRGEKRTNINGVVIMGAPWFQV